MLGIGDCGEFHEAYCYAMCAAHTGAPHSVLCYMASMDEWHRMLDGGYHL